MDKEPQDEYMTDAGAYDASISQLPSTVYANGLPTPVSATFPQSSTFFTEIGTEAPLPSASMADESAPSKGKGKRAAEGMDNDNETANQAITVPCRTSAPRIIRRHHHRRRNVAASVWGPQLPLQPQPANQPFNIYKAILRHPNLFFQFAIRLPPTTIIDLYTIDKEFHYRFNKYSTSIIHDYASYHAPQAAYIFSWVLFPELCISDPMLRPMDGRPHLARDIPSLRWTKLVLYRDAVARAILAVLGSAGLRVPKAVHSVLMKYWLLMEMNTTPLRQAFLTDETVWSNTDILLFHLFLVKLDMFITHPVHGHGGAALAPMLLTQKSLTTLFHVLIGKRKMDYDEATDMLVRTYLTEDLDTDTHTWLDDEIENGVPEEEWGILCREGRDMDGERMESALDQVIMEGVHRGLDAERFLLDFVLYGFVDYGTGRNVPAPRKWRGERKVVIPKEAWPLESARTGVIKRFDRRFGCEMVQPSAALVRVSSPDSTGLDGEIEVEAMDEGE